MDRSAPGMLLREHVGAHQGIVNARTGLRTSSRVARFDKLFALH